MKTVKKLSILCLAVLMLFALVACNNDQVEENAGVLTLTADKTTANAGDTVTFSALLTKGEETSVPTDVTYAIVEGADYATIAGNKLTVKDTVPNGTLIKVNATLATEGEDALTSNTVEITVSKPLTALAITADKSGEVDRGSLINLSLTKTPEDSLATVTWTVVEGADYATVEGTKLFIDGSAIGGTVIKVKAVSGTVESNVLTFTVKLNQEELNDNRYILSFDEDKVTLDKNGDAQLLTVSVYNGNFEEITDQIVDYVVLDGDDFVSVSTNNNICTLTALGHGTATVRATIRGTAISETAEVKVIVPPTAINLPEMFNERPNLEYSFSMKNPANNAAYTLPFTATAVGSKVCQDMTVTFADASGNTENVATYTNNGITFLKTGVVTVTVSSNSGSRVETKTTYKFNVNNGYNVSSFEELVALANNPAYTGSLPINLVVTAKPVSATGYAYGYDIVPAVALQANQAYADVTNPDKTSINFYNKGAIINGNRHKIDASQVRIPTSAEIDANTPAGAPRFDRHGALLCIEPQYDDNNARDLATYRVELRDLTVVGNCPIDYETTAQRPSGVYYRGILIGKTTDSDNIDDQPVNYYLTTSNVNAEAFITGIRLLHVVAGQLDNTKVDNCFMNGLEIGGSVLTLNNTTYGACGAAGIELIGEDSDKAGATRDQRQQITYAGNVTVTFANNNQTRYMQNYKLDVGMGPMTIHQILMGCVEANGLTNTQISHFQNANEELYYVSLAFIGRGNCPNYTQIIYPGFQSGGIINAKDIPDGTINTTCEYIVVDISIPGVGSLGQAYFYNHNYAGN